LDSNLKIAISMGGSIGDVLNTTALAVGLKRQFPQSDMTMFLFKGSEILRGNKIINTIKVVDHRIFIKEIEKQRANYDIFCEVRYPARFFFSPEALKRKDVMAFKSHWEPNFLRHHEKMWNEFLSNIRRLDDFCEKNNMTAYDLRRDSSGLEYDDDDQFLMVSENDFRASERFKGLRMVLVNNSGIIGTMTKSWSLRSWEEIIKYLKSMGLYVVQVGTPTETEIPGIQDRFSGTIHETAALMKRAKFNIFIEGGLVHVAKAVKKKSIVLFGPTPIHVFGYPENINLRGKDCTPCWHPRGVKFDWNKVCAITRQQAIVDTPACMRSLEISDVKKAVNSLLVENGILSKKRAKNV
jgi:ADP-heptose:LPS heptosyltransferase